MFLIASRTSSRSCSEPVFPQDNHEVIDFTEQPEVSDAFEQLLVVRSVLEDAKRDEAQL